jgi:hypothetical protein
MIDNPKIQKLFPTDLEFMAKIEHFANDLAYVAQCRHCGGKIAGHIHMPGAINQTVQQRENAVFQVLKRRHACPYKIEQWGDKTLPGKIAPDIMRGFEKLKEQAFLNKKIGKA